MDPIRVSGVIAAVGGPMTFYFDTGPGGANATAITSSHLIQGLLISAILNGSKVTYQLVPGSNVIQRVEPFGVAPPPSRLNGGYVISRLATQRDPNGEHLEAFIRKSNETEETAYNITDESFQQLLILSFGAGSMEPVEFNIVFDVKEIASIQLGKTE